MARPKPLSGFPEFSPSGRIVEQRVLASLADTFELHGFGSIETRAVEPMEQLTRKGEIDKEVFVVRRLHAATDAADELGLHFDLTVPFARSVGRTDLPGGDPKVMSRTLSDVVLALPDTSALLPGHGSQTTLARERLENPYLQAATSRN